MLCLKARNLTFVSTLMDTIYKFLNPIKGIAKYSLCSFIVAADQEILAVFNDISKSTIRCIAHVTEIDRSRISFVSSIGQLAESAMFITLSGRLIDKISESFVQDKIKYINVDLFNVPGRFSVGVKECIRLIGIPENIKCRTIAGDKLVFRY